MNVQQAKKFLLLIGAPQPKIVVGTAGWVKAPCPLAPWTHDHGTDSNPSFAIECKTDRFNCFACKSGDLWYLLQMLKGFGAKPPKYNLKEAVDLLTEQEEKEIQLEIHDEYVPTIELDIPWPEDWLASFPSAKKVPLAVDYLKKRNVPLWMIDEFDLRCDTSMWRVCFPIRNWKGQLVGLRGRYIDPPEGYPSYHMYDCGGVRNGLPWFGENWVDLNQPVCMVESVFDLLSVYQVYENVIAPLTVGMSEVKVKRLSGATDIVTMFDNGEGGDKARKLINKYLPHAVKVHRKPPPFRKDPGEMDPDEVRAVLHDVLPLKAKEGIDIH